MALADNRVTLADDTYLRNSILHPSAQIVAGYTDIMPPFEGQLSEEQVLALVAFIQSLKAGETPRRVEAYPPPTKTQIGPVDRKIP